MDGKRVLLTGGAGFIGSHVAERLLHGGLQVTVVDNFDEFYPRGIKKGNIAATVGQRGYVLKELDICDFISLRRHLDGGFDAIVHLAAKAGVRASLADPVQYQMVNVIGTQNMLELARLWDVRQFIFASSSSVYGIDQRVPWREEQLANLPISPYAATKLSGELIGHVYSHLYGIRFLALRLFTVFGPRQRPDLAIHRMAKQLIGGRPLTIFGDGSVRRDYTYVDDVVSGIVSAIHYGGSPHEVLNLGAGRTVSLKQVVEALEKATGLRAMLRYEANQPGDVPTTLADTAKAKSLLGYEPLTSFQTGIDRFVSWLKETSPPQFLAG